MKKTFISAIFTIVSLITFGQSKETIAILGDSYSTFEGYLTPDTMDIWYFNRLDERRTDVCKVTQTWWWQVIKEGGYKLGINNSWSGSTVCNTGYNDEDYTNKSFITRMNNLANPDIILVFGGTNDAWAKVPLGEYKYDEFRTADKFCFRPALAFMLSHMQERYPNVKIYFISNCDLSIKYTESIKEVCKHYEIPVIQLTDIAKQNGHPNIEGMHSIARQVLKELKKD